MMPDLGRYAFEVSLAYIASLALLAALIAWVWWRSARTGRELADMEARVRSSQ
jgi:heme exporter protein D